MKNDETKLVWLRNENLQLMHAWITTDIEIATHVALYGGTQKDALKLRRRSVPLTRKKSSRKSTRSDTGPRVRRRPTVDGSEDDDVRISSSSDPRSILVSYSMLYIFILCLFLLNYYLYFFLSLAHSSL